MKRVIVITGMHRSGTSTITKGIISLGADSGHNLLGSNYANEKGYFEDKNILNLNETIFNHLGFKWSDFEDYRLDRFSNLLPLYNDIYKDKAIQIIQDLLEDTETLVIKDPRFCLLISFWKSIFAEIDVQVDYILCIRNPNDVAGSLSKRNGLSIAHGKKLWLFYNLAFLNQINEEIYIVDFTSFIKSKGPIIQLSKELKLHNASSQDIDDFLNVFVDESLIHSNTHLELNDEFSKFYHFLYRKNFEKHFFNKISWGKSLARGEKENRKIQNQLFIKQNSKFGETDSIKINTKEGLNVIRFKLDAFDETSNFRFDPGNNKACVIIYDIYAIKNKKRIDLLEKNGSYSFRNNRFYLFNKPDPQIYFSCPHDIYDEFVIKFWVSDNSSLIASLLNAIEKKHKNQLINDYEKILIERSTLKSDFDFIKSETSIILKEVNSNSKSLAEIATKITNEIKQSEIQNRTIDDNATKISENNKSISEHYNVIKQHDKSISQHDKTISQHDKTISQHDELIENTSQKFQKSINDIESVAFQNINSIKSNNEKISLQMSETTELSQKLAKQKLILSANLETIGDLLEEDKRLKASVDTLMKSNLEARKVIDSLIVDDVSMRALINQSLEDQRNKFNSVLSQINSVAGQQKNHEKKTDQLNTEINKKIKDLINMQKTLSEASRQILVDNYRKSKFMRLLRKLYRFVKNPKQSIKKMKYEKMLKKSYIFDTHYYLHSHDYVYSNIVNLYEFYLEANNTEYLDINPLFDTKFYTRKYMNVELNDKPLIHYLMTRDHYNINQPHPLFDSKFYLKKNPDVLNAKMNPLEHFLQWGWAEGRDPHPLFSCDYYNKQLEARGVEVQNPLLHYCEAGWKESFNPHPNFDNDYYAEQILVSGVVSSNPLIHFVTEGWRKGLNPTHKIYLDSEISNFERVISIMNNHNSEKDINTVSKYKSEKKLLEKLKIILYLEGKHNLDIILEKLGDINQPFDLVVFYCQIDELQSTYFEILKKVSSIELIESSDDKHPLLNLKNSEILNDEGIFLYIHNIKNDYFSININNIIPSADFFTELYEMLVSSEQCNIIVPILGHRIIPDIIATQFNNFNHKFDKKVDNLGYSPFGMYIGNNEWLREVFSLIDENITKCTLNIEEFDTLLSLNQQTKKNNLITLDYKITNGGILPVWRNISNPLILTLNDIENAYTKLDIYFQYKLILKSKLYDGIWYYTNYPGELADGRDGIEEFLRSSESKYLSKEHKKVADDLIFTDDGLYLKRDNQMNVIATLDSSFFSDNISFSKKGLKTNDTDVQVSIICTSYNHENFIAEAIESMVNQKTNFKYEILIGDDCSTDSTQEIISTYAKEYPELINAILRPENIGPKANHLDLFNKAKGKYICLNEGDDYWTDLNKLQIQFDYMEENEHCSLCYHPVRVLDDNDTKFQSIIPKNLPQQKFDIGHLIHQNLIQTNSVMYRGNPLKGYILSPGLMPGDWFRHLVHSLYGEIHYINKVMSVYRKHDGGIWSGLKLFEKGFSVGQVLFYRDLNQITEQNYHVDLLKRLYTIFSKLYWKFFENCQIEDLYNLIAIDHDLSNLFFTNNNISLKSETINSVDELKNAFEEMYKIDVVITAYKHSEYIEQAIDSVVQQKGMFKLNVIIADDCSPDDSADVIKNAVEKYSCNNITILETEKNLGMLKNLERSFQMCDGDFIAICEGDDYWISELKLQKQLTLMIQNPDYSMCFNWLLLEYLGSSKMEPHPGQTAIQDEFINFEHILKTGVTANFSCCFYRNATVKSIPSSYFETPNAADWLFNLYAADMGKVGFLKQLLSVYRIHSGGQWSGLTEIQQMIRKQEALNRYLNFFPKHLVEIEKLIVPISDSIDSKQSLIKDNSIKMNIDNLKIDQSFFTIKGWSFIENQPTYYNENKFITLSMGGSKVVLKQVLQNIRRLDVNRAFNDKGFDRTFCGFDSVVIMPSEPLPDGEYKIGMLIESEGRSSFKLTHRTIRIFDNKFVSKRILV